MSGAFEVLDLRANLRRKVPDATVALAFSWRLCRAVEPHADGFIYRRICITKHDHCGVVHPTLDAALAVYRDDLAFSRATGSTVTEHDEGEPLDAFIERHVAALRAAREMRP